MASADEINRIDKYCITVNAENYEKYMELIVKFYNPVCHARRSNWFS